MVRVHSGLPFQVGALFLPVISYRCFRFSAEPDLQPLFPFLWRNH